MSSPEEKENIGVRDEDMNSKQLFQSLLRKKGDTVSPSNKVPVGSPENMGLMLRQPLGAKEQAGQLITGSPTMGLPEATARRFGQGLFHMGDEIEAGAGVINQYRQPMTESDYSDPAKGAALRYLGMSPQDLPQERVDISGLVYDALVEPSKIGNIYSDKLEQSRALNEQALKDQPASYLFGDLPGTAASLAIAGPVYGSMAHGFGASEGGLLDDTGQVVLDTGIGLGVGKFAQLAGRGLARGIGMFRNRLSGIQGSSLSNKILGSAGALSGGAYAYSKGGDLSDVAVGTAAGYMGSRGIFGNSPVSEQMIKKAPTAANWMLKKFTPLAKKGLQFAIMETFPSYLPNMSVVRDVQDRQTVSNIIMNNNNLDSEAKASRIERVMKEGALRYDDLPDDWYIQRGVEPEIQDDMLLRRPQMEE